jgi:hypothetical protein
MNGIQLLKINVGECNVMKTRSIEGRKVVINRLIIVEITRKMKNYMGFRK